MKKAGLIILVLLFLAGIGLMLRLQLTIPKEEGVAHLTTVRLKPFSSLDLQIGLPAYALEGRPAVLLDLPEGIIEGSDELYYFNLPTCGQEMFAIMQSSADTCKVWIDSNFNGHLSDEQPLRGKPWTYKDSGYAYALFDFGKVKISDGQFFNLTGRAGWLKRSPIAYKAGKIRIGNLVYRIAAFDVDYDGAFTTLFKPGGFDSSRECDSLLLDENASAFWKAYNVTRLRPLGHFYKIGADYFKVKFSDDGDTIEISAAEPVSGILKLANNKHLEATLYSDAATQFISFSDEIKLPVGSYQMAFGTLTCIDKDGKDWKLYAQFSEDKRQGHFQITENEITTIDPGPPFAVTTAIRNANHDGILYIDGELVGREGESYGLQFSRNMSQPTLKILDENNTEIHSGTMEYG